MPRFSIIVPLYNSEQFIGRCLSSVFNQSFKDYEIILVDDGSTDDTKQRLLELFAREHFTEYLYHYQENQGAGCARNSGIALAKGDYIVFVDSDDYLDAVFLEMASGLIDDDNPDLVFIDIVREDPEGKIIRFETMSKYRSLTRERFLRNQLTGKIPWGGVRKIVKTKIIKDNCIRFGEIPVGEEVIYSFDVLKNSKTVCYLSDVYYHYVENKTSLSSVVDIKRTVRVLEYEYDEIVRRGLFKEYGDTVGAMAYTSLAISVYALSKSRPVKSALAEIKPVRSECLGVVDRFVDFSAMDIRVRLCYPFLKWGFCLPIVLAVKLRSFLSRS